MKSKTNNEHRFFYKHIIDGVIESTKEKHPLDGLKDKTTCIELLIKDLNIRTYINISGDKKNLFSIYFNDQYYNIYIEFIDGGGEDLRNDSDRKKVTIPYAQSAFKKYINEFDKIIVIGIYVPLFKNLKPDYENRVYVVVDPNEIYGSQVINNDEKNPSSRWTTLRNVLQVLKTKEKILSKKGNVTNVHKNNIAIYFENELKNKYLNMFENVIKDDNFLKKMSSFNKGDIKEYQSQTIKNYNKYAGIRNLFRQILITERGSKCEILNCKIKIPELMVASHILPVNAIDKDLGLTEKEKEYKIKDKNNGLILCQNHDALFDRFLLTFDLSNGFAKLSKRIADEYKSLDINLGVKSIEINSDKMKDYLKYHNDIFDKNNK